MQLSQHTIAVLKNFATINPSIAVDAGSNLLHTVANTEDMYAAATVQDTFPVSFAIYDLNQFISAVSLFANPTFDFAERYVTIKDGRKQIRYLYADRHAIKLPRSSTVRMPPTVFKAQVSHQAMNELLKAAAVLQLPQVAVMANPDEGTVNAMAVDMRNVGANKFDAELDVVELNAAATAVFRAEKLRLLPGEYTVTVAKGIGHFSTESEHGTVNYYIGAEDVSQWEE